MMIQYSIFTGRVPRDSWIRGPEGGGRIIGEVCHFTDLCRFVVSSRVEQVFAVAAAPAGSGSTADDCLQITMSFADGSLAAIAYTSIASADLPKERIVASCGGGTAVVDDFCSTRFHSMKARNMKGVQSKGFAEEMDAFSAAARKSLGSPIPFKDLEESSRIIFAVEESLRKGQPVRM